MLARQLKMSALFLGLSFFATNAHAKDVTPRTCSAQTKAAKKVIALEFGITEASVAIDASEVCRQTNNTNSQIDIVHAVRNSIKSFLHDASQVESPRALVLDLAFAEANLPWSSPPPAEVNAIADRMLRDYINQPTTKIALLSLEESPEGGESIEANWVIKLKIGSLSDHIFWAVTDRQGTKPTYNYGFN